MMTSRSLFKSGLYLAFGLVLAWSVGLMVFAQKVAALETPGPRRTDAIVALTGELIRLREAISLLKADEADRLFISGVYRGVDVEELLGLLREDTAEFDCCIDVGYVAANTRGNASETAQWVDEQNIRSIRLVTSNYHMPRTLLEFRRRMPDLDILPHPVNSERATMHPWYRNPISVRLLSTEFSKYLVVLVGG